MERFSIIYKYKNNLDAPWKTIDFNKYSRSGMRRDWKIVCFKLIH